MPFASNMYYGQAVTIHLAHVVVALIGCDRNGAITPGLGDLGRGIETWSIGGRKSYPFHSISWVKFVSRSRA
jgi:hypothetical protein